MHFFMCAVILRPNLSLKLKASRDIVRLIRADSRRDLYAYNGSWQYQAVLTRALRARPLRLICADMRWVSQMQFGGNNCQMKALIKV